MEIHSAIARWESEGGAIPQGQKSRKRHSERIKPLTVRRVLVPIDFSPESLKTLRYARRLGERFKAKLHLVYVVTALPPFLPQPEQALPSNFTQEMAASAIDRLEQIATEFSLPSPHRQYTVRIGMIADEISKVARVTRAELIAIATHGYSGFKRALLGSTTESVVRKAPCPVLVVREKQDGSTNQRARKSALQFRKILVPLDFSEPSRLGLEYALGLRARVSRYGRPFPFGCCQRVSDGRRIHGAPSTDADRDPARVRKSRDAEVARSNFSKGRRGPDKDRSRVTGRAPCLYREHGGAPRALRNMPGARGAEPGCREDAE